MHGERLNICSVTFYHFSSLFTSAANNTCVHPRVSTYPNLNRHTHYEKLTLSTYLSLVAALVSPNPTSCLQIKCKLHPNMDTLTTWTRSPLPFSNPRPSSETDCPKTTSKPWGDEAHAMGRAVARRESVESRGRQCCHSMTQLILVCYRVLWAQGWQSPTHLNLPVYLL